MELPIIGSMIEEWDRYLLGTYILIQNEDVLNEK